MSHLLSILIIVPLIAMIVVLALPKQFANLYRLVAVGATGVQLLICLLVCKAFLTGDQDSGFQLVERFDWISFSLGDFGHFSSTYYLGVDGLSVGMVLLSGIVMFFGAIASWNITKQSKGYFALYLLLSSTVVGCFIALDMLLFYLFFEFMLLPMFFLIGIWGGVRREYASIKFFLYTLAGSIFILLVMIGLYISTIDPSATAVKIGLIESNTLVTDAVILQVQELLARGMIKSEYLVHTFDMVAMADMKNIIPQSLFSPLVTNELMFGLPAREIAFLAVFIGFAIKLPAVPVHTWLPDAHVEAPTAVSVVLAGVLLKIGGYGLLRIAYSIFPNEANEYAYMVAFLGVVAIIYGAYNALAMKDLKKLIAYSSVSHMGYVLLGIASATVEGVTGAVYQMFSHGIISSMLFLVVGVIYDRTHDRTIENYRGLASKMPMYTAVVTLSFFASLGLPGFSGFIAEIFVFLGAFSSESANGLVPNWLVIVALIGLVIGAAYYLWTLQRMFFGNFWVKNKEVEASLTDLNTREYIMLIPLAALALIYGLFPNLLLDFISPTVNKFVEVLTMNL